MKWLDENPGSDNIPGSRVPPEEMHEIYLQATAKCVLLDWKNVDNDDGEPLKYTPEEGLKVLHDDEYHEFQTWLYLQAGSRVRYRKVAQEEAVKNSVRSSNGSTSGDPMSSGSELGKSAVAE